MPPPNAVEKMATKTPIGSTQRLFRGHEPGNGKSDHADVFNQVVNGNGEGFKHEPRNPSVFTVNGETTVKYQYEAIVLFRSDQFNVFASWQ